MAKSLPIEFNSVYGEEGSQIPETTLEFFGKGRNPPIRSTPLSISGECRRKLLYAYKWGIQPKVLERPLTMGSFVHSVLQALYMGKSEEEALSSIETTLKQHQEELLGWADKAGFLPNGQDLKATLSQLEEDYHKARAMAICFWRFVPFKVDKWEVLHDPDGNPMVEKLLSCTLEGHELLVPCDLVLRNKETGSVWIVDFKTTTFDPNIRSIPTKISPQLALYRLVLQSHLDSWGTGLRVAGSFHAIIRKPTIKYCPDSKDAGGFHTYIDRMVKWYKAQVEADPKNPPLLLTPNNFHGPLLSPELWRRIQEYINLADASPDLATFFKAGDSACLKYNKPCPYMTLCNSSPVMWPGIVRDYYQIKYREDSEELGANKQDV